MYVARKIKHEIAEPRDEEEDEVGEQPTGNTSGSSGVDGAQKADIGGIEAPPHKRAKLAHERSDDILSQKLAQMSYMPMESKSIISLAHLKFKVNELSNAQTTEEVEATSQCIADNQALLSQMTKSMRSAISELKKATSEDQREAKRKFEAFVGVIFLV